ncbi:transcriptional regulator [Candidatus Vecturithrix granuli]|uniref:Transcriptional regulator n=1 Tax=Vecturithrix granuli TaxID=1499967 RepID=A0A0S6WBC2_VECG1|nr:transcriptional regulator [Candidatus Vecturithrix granuli]
MNIEKTNPTLEDVASHSGVSIATVSRVINASGPVRKEVEERVKRVIEELGFEPRRKRLKTRTKPAMIACIAPEFLNPANAQILTGVQEESEKMGIHLLIVPVSEKPGSLHQNLQVLTQITVDGVILHHLGVEPQEVLDVCNRQEIPMVVLRRDIATPRIHCIDTDRENGMYQAAKFLLNLNHTQIAYLSSSPGSEVAQARLRGVRRALNEANFALKPEFYRECLSTVDDGFRAANNLLRLPVGKRPTAILAYNDLVAIGALHAIRTAGLMIPEDISVVGFDNIPLTSHTNPPLTTVAQPHYQKGQLAVQKLYYSLNGDDETDREGLTLLECSLVVRESTGPCCRKTN